MDERREADQKWRKDLKASLEGKIDDLGDQVEQIREILVGGLQGDGGLQVRFSQLETKYVKYLRIKSELLSKFWGTDTYLGAWVPQRRAC